MNLHKYHTGDVLLKNNMNSVFTDGVHIVTLTENVITIRKDGKLHRLDGPAVEYSNGLKHWYTDGSFVKSELTRNYWPSD